MLLTTLGFCVAKMSQVVSTCQDFSRHVASKKPGWVFRCFSDPLQGWISEFTSKIVSRLKMWNACGKLLPVLGGLICQERGTAKWRSPQSNLPQDGYKILRIEVESTSTIFHPLPCKGELLLAISESKSWPIRSGNRTSASFRSACSLEGILVWMTFCLHTSLPIPVDTWHLTSKGNMGLKRNWLILRCCPLQSSGPPQAQRDEGYCLVIFSLLGGPLLFGSPLACALCR